MRATQHSGRMGSPRHNDRHFDMEKAGHIDKGKTSDNYYRSYKRLPFEEAERQFYQDHFQGMIDDINERARKSYHPERMTDVDKLLQSKKTMPEEVILQIGDKDTHVTPEQLQEVADDFLRWHNRKFGEHVVSLNSALHVDEQTPHIHWRRVWMYEHEKGFMAIGQHKALERLGYELPDKSKPRGRNNNLKQVYTAECREKWLEICREHGLDVEEKPLHKAPNEQNLKKNDYILHKQEQELLGQEILVQKNQHTLLEQESTLKKNQEFLDKQKRTYGETREKLLKAQKGLEAELGKEKYLQGQIEAKMEELKGLEGRILTAEEVSRMKPKKTLTGKADMSYEDVLDLIRTAEHVNSADEIVRNCEKIVQKMIFEKQKEKAAADILEEAKNELSFEKRVSRAYWEAELNKRRTQRPEQQQQRRNQQQDLDR